MVKLIRLGKFLKEHSFKIRKQFNNLSAKVIDAKIEINAEYTAKNISLR